MADEKITTAKAPETKAPETKARTANPPQGKTAAKAKSQDQSKAGEPKAEKMALRITSKVKEGFRRCGVRHPYEAVEYPEGRFTAKQVKQLKEEPNLVVQEL